MFWRWFKKKSNLVLPPPHQQRWGVSQSECDGAPLIVRYNVTAREWAGQAELPIKLGFAIPLNRPNAGGLPDAEENAALAEIEEVVAREVFATTTAVFAMVLTTGIMKELVFYVAPDTDVPALREKIQENVATHEVQCMAGNEPRWDSYRAFAP